MAPKKPAAAKASGPKKKRMMSFELKKEIIRQHEQGMRVVDLAQHYDRTTSTICTILKQKASIMAMEPAKGVQVVSRLRTSLHEDMEKLLAAWLAEQPNGVVMTEAAICDRARAIYNSLLQAGGGSAGGVAVAGGVAAAGDARDTRDSFKASRGWFENFKRRSTSGSFAGAAAGYRPQQVFACGQTGLFWKRLPRRAYLRLEEEEEAEEEEVGRAMDDRLAVALSANATGDCRVKPLLVYHAENPRAFSSHHVLPEQLPVMWRANARARLTRQFLVEWLNSAFGPEVKRYLLENDLPLQALLVLDSSRHPDNLQDDILEEFQFVHIVYLPPSSSLQPVDQCLVQSFRAHFTKHLFRRCFEATVSTSLTLRQFWSDHYNIVVCLGIIDMAWQAEAAGRVAAAWHRLWPEAVPPPSPSAADSGADDDALDEIVSVGRSMGLEVDEQDVLQLLAEHDQLLTTQQLRQLQTQQLAEAWQEAADAGAAVDEEAGQPPTASEDSDTDDGEATPTAEIQEMLTAWERLADFVQKKHPEKAATRRAMELFSDTCLAHFRHILETRMDQPQFFHCKIEAIDPW